MYKSLFSHLQVYDKYITSDRIWWLYKLESSSLSFIAFFSILYLLKLEIHARSRNEGLILAPTLETYAPRTSRVSQ